MSQIAEFVSVLTCGLFAGAAAWHTEAFPILKREELFE